MTLLENQRSDPLLPLVAEVVSEILKAGDTVTPLDVLLRLEILDSDTIEAWRRGGLPYLERAISSGLARVNRILRLVHEHSLALGLEPVRGKYFRAGKGAKRRLRFSKRGDDESERAYATHFVRRNT